MPRLNEKTHTEDNLLKGFSYQELIDTVYANEKEINESVVLRVCVEILQLQLADCHENLAGNLQEITSIIKKARE